MSKPLSEKVALVTGSSRGIGAAIARKFAGHGANVAITYGASKDKAEAVAKSVEELGVKVLLLHGDASHPEAMPGLVDAVIKKFEARHPCKQRRSVRRVCAGRRYFSRSL